MKPFLCRLASARRAVLAPAAASLLVLALPAAGLAQMDSSSNPPATSTNPADTLSHGDIKFIVTVAEGSTNEVALSQLAAEHSSRDDVKKFAQMMITDHTKLNSMLTDLAARKGVAISDAVMKGQKDDVDSLAAKNGADFDKAYIKMMVKSHKETLALFQKESEKGKDPDVMSFASQNTPTISEHLEHAKMLASASP
jgi:putative membrane protein